MDYNGNGTNPQQRDIVLSPNEYLFVQSNTNGIIKTYAGPITITISAQDSIVKFNGKSKKFEATNNVQEAKGLFVTPPENWYAILKNPAKNNETPEGGKANTSPELQVGRKVNIRGPVSFALYPGQMAKVVKGHTLRSNQYLLARVYDAEAANQNQGKVYDAEGKEVENTTTNCINGQILVIKGTEISFYIPPTGIEVIPINEKNGEYVRDAITLERLEYAILKDEDGEKRYVHGPAVVFPKPTEVFVESPKGGSIFRALELSPISGIYIKVIAAYKDEAGVEHPTGEELFITGKEQMIYYPRPEHAMIQYDGKYMHHAIAIPEGEGRYILNRLTGEIKTVKGPQMYLPDPRFEIVVKRKLTNKECKLFYPGNMEVLQYNDSISEKNTELLARKGLASTSAMTDAINSAYSTSNQESTLAIFEVNSAISRGTSYTKPRTITLDTKYEGVVGINVWTGYAVNAVSKSGKREVVIGPTTRLLDYDETLEAITLSTGCPKTTHSPFTTAYLRIENNKVSDIIYAQTKDFVNVAIKVSYCVNFLEEYKDKWFSVENYVKYLTDRMRSVIKNEVKEYSIQDFYNKSINIVRDIVLDHKNNNSKKEDKTENYKGRFFPENGMLIHDVEVLDVSVDSNIDALLQEHQYEMISKTLELSDAENRMKVITALAEVERREAELKNANKTYALKLEQQLQEEKLAKEEALKVKQRAAEEAEAKAKHELQEVLTKIQEAELQRKKAISDAKLAEQKAMEEIESEKLRVQAETVESIMKSISPDLVAALTSNANASLLETAAKHMSPYALAKGEPIAETVDKLLRGTTLEGIMTNVMNK